MNTSQHWQTPEKPPAQSEQLLSQSLAAGRHSPKLPTLLPSWPLLQTKLGPTAFICQGLPLRFIHNWNFCSMSRLDFYILTALCPLKFAHWNAPILAFFSLLSCWIATPSSSCITESKGPFTAGDTGSSFRFLEKRRLLQSFNNKGAYKKDVDFLSGPGVIGQGVMI